ncbi:AI-2E family transporter [Fusibacter paucivorans]|uniref:AI-2E family transporter n=1 Tax=Fusibacter paucivorans TaxID=76009 RepID=A0ABS5PPX0_9FIRM|nr:AI-2E family transporter [Fusibacter paucivorans]MBS7527213.1 AI-2E family transporter [Fusibacter paucivorans]
MNLPRKQYIEYVVIFFIVAAIAYWLGRDIDSIKFAIAKFFTLLTPFFIGFAVAYILNAPVSAIEKRLKIKRGWAIAIIYIAFVAIISSALIILTPLLGNNIAGLINDVSRWAVDIPKWVQQFDFGPYEEVITTQMSKLTELLSTLTNSLLRNIVDMLFAVTTTVFNIVLGIIISIYMLSDKQKLQSAFHQLSLAVFKRKRTDQLIAFLKEVNVIFGHFFTGLLVEAIIVGILAAIGLSLMGVRYAPILGLIICLTNMIPYFGAFIGAVPAVLATLMYDPIKAIWVAVFIIVLQQVDGNVIGPRVMGNYIGLEPLWIIFAIAFGGGFGGLLGMILAIPLGAVVKIIITRLVTKNQPAAIDEPSPPDKPDAPDEPGSADKASLPDAPSENR